MSPLATPAARVETRTMRVSCDSFVALGQRTATGSTVFAKNSDRPAAECQPLKQVAQHDHEPGSRLRCQYIEIDQVERTYGFTGAGPYWLWGLEHGVNDHGVAIGNNSIFTKDAVPDQGLQGMDLVRLALERGGSAAEAAGVIAELIERYGQGGSGYLDTHWAYNNSFLIADASAAFLLEASARHWALRRIQGAGSASNHATITDDWDRVSSGCAAHACTQGWWSGEGRLDFAAAYRDTSVVPPVVSSGRYAQTCAAARAPVDLASVKRLMRDHYNGATVYSPGRPPDDERYYSVCMHADPVGTTTASLVIELEAENPLGAIYWAAFASPCIGPFIPLFTCGELPGELMQGGETPEQGGAWWRFKALLGEVEKDYPRRASVVREYWDTFEQRLAERANALKRPASGIPVGGEGEAEFRRRATAFMAEAWRDTSAALDEIILAVQAL